MLKVFNLHLSKWKAILCGGDICCYFLSVLAGLYFNPQVGKPIWEFILEFKVSYLLVGLVYLVVFVIADFYDYQQDFRQPANIARIFVGSWIGTLVVVIIFYFPLGVFIGRTLLIIQAITFSCLLALWRFVWSSMALTQIMQKRILIIGSGRSGQHLLKAIRERPRCGIFAVGFVDDDPKKMATIIDRLPVLGDCTKLNDLIKEYNIHMAVDAITHQKSSQLLDTLIEVSWNGCPIMDMPTMFEFITGKLPTGHISDDWIFQWSLNSIKLYYRRLKRVVDVVLAIITLTIFLPLFLLISLSIKIDSRGPIFFRQPRLGKEGRLFNILKFRTMINNAENFGPAWTTNKDPRITKVGKVIRKLRLDELPQFINIFKGDMSFIGPRPLVPSGNEEKIPYHKYRLLVKPGMTGWAQVMYHESLTPDTVPERIKYDLYYIKNMGFLLDFIIILKTMRIVLSRRGT